MLKPYRCCRAPMGASRIGFGGVVCSCGHRRMAAAPKSRTLGRCQTPPVRLKRLSQTLYRHCRAARSRYAYGGATGFACLRAWLGTIPNHRAAVVHIGPAVAVVYARHCPSCRRNRVARLRHRRTHRTIQPICFIADIQRVLGVLAFAARLCEGLLPKPSVRRRRALHGQLHIQPDNFCTFDELALYEKRPQYFGGHFVPPLRQSWQ